MCVCLCLCVCLRVYARLESLIAAFKNPSQRGHAENRHAWVYRLFHHTTNQVLHNANTNLFRQHTAPIPFVPTHTHERSQTTQSDMTAETGACFCLQVFFTWAISQHYIVRYKWVEFHLSFPSTQQFSCEHKYCCCCCKAPKSPSGFVLSMEHSAVRRCHEPNTSHSGGIPVVVHWGGSSAGLSYLLLHLHTGTIAGLCHCVL